jgi:hypothetical protein
MQRSHLLFGSTDTADLFVGEGTYVLASFDSKFANGVDKAFGGVRAGHFHGARERAQAACEFVPDSVAPHQSHPACFELQFDREMPLSPCVLGSTDWDCSLWMGIP